jgi:predicted PurR-regulated permease PerM
VEILKTYQQEIILALGILFASLVFVYLYSILLPFVLGLGLAFAVMPLIKKMQRWLKYQNLTITVFLGLLGTAALLFLVFFAAFVNRDFQRLNHSFSLLASENQAQIDAGTRQVKEYLSGLYDFSELENSLKSQADSLKGSLAGIDKSQLDTESIGAAYEKLMSVFKKEEPAEVEEKSSFGFFYLLFSSLFYFVLILYHFDYFDGLRQKYHSGKVESTFSLIYEDFRQSFLRYFRLRTQIVLLMLPVYVIAFVVLDIPGMILMTLLIFLLSFIPYFQYLALIPLALSCLVLALERDQSFFLFFGIVLGVFALVSLIEELVLTPRIMEKNIGMNPVIMILAVSVWTYLLGVPGLLIGIPLTSLFIIYVKRYLLSAYEVVLQEEESDA